MIISLSRNKNAEEAQQDAQSKQKGNRNITISY